MMKFFLLDDTNHFVAILPYTFPIVVAIITYLFKLSQSREKARLDKVDEDNEKDHANFMEYIKSLEKAIEDLRKNLSELNIQILKEISSMAVKLAEYKRDIR